MSTNYFRDACGDFKYLRERRYPEKATLKLVGDRHRLSRVQRNCLFRGIIIGERADARRRKISAPRDVAGSSLGIDWYNALITVESYLRGVALFISDDGVVRDSSATHGSYRRTGVTERALKEIIDALRELRPGRIDAFLDSPIAFSGAMAEELRERLVICDCPVTVSLSHSADYPLKSFDGPVASSDSVILDSALRILDLPRYVLERGFGFIPPPLLDLFPSDPSEPGQSSGSESPVR
jgi:hypothetical protein